MLNASITLPFFNIIRPLFQFEMVTHVTLSDVVCIIVNFLSSEVYSQFSVLFLKLAKDEFNKPKK